MTGFGDARKQNDRLSIAVEVRAVNNRYLKISIKAPDAYASLEGDLEKLVRESIIRGTVQIDVRANRIGGESRYVLNKKVLEEYWKELNQLAEIIHVAAPVDLASLLDLPGAVVEDDLGFLDTQSDWPLIRETMTDAIQKLQSFRTAEGRSMEQNLRTNEGVISEQLDRINERAPQVVRDYRDQIKVRVEKLLEGTEAKIEDADLIREVSIFSERCDINEEITRLRSHLEQFDIFLDEKTSQGRKLEFLSQEMFRETNTIGSKANNVKIAHSVVEMKAAIEKMREILQNVE
jgi:uncharacterized protein (TIGR00255 family)